MQRRRVCGVEELPPGTMKLVAAGKFGVGVYNVGGELYAIANYCAHEGAPLCTGCRHNVHSQTRSTRVRARQAAALASVELT
jgi:nitrite reductase/ring-hydroxylating ferredoxin subunit